MPPVTLPLDVEAALREFAAAHGRTWKSKLRDLWTSGRDEGPLRQARNVLGPSGLHAYRLPAPALLVAVRIRCPLRGDGWTVRDVAAPDPRPAKFGYQEPRDTAGTLRGSRWVPTREAALRLAETGAYLLPAADACSCGDSWAHEVASRATLDGCRVTLWNDGGLSLATPDDHPQPRAAVVGFLGRAAAEAVLAAAELAEGWDEVVELARSASVK